MTLSVLIYSSKGWSGLKDILGQIQVEQDRLHGSGKELR